jgi:DNA-binding NarL/FixJ family response regulator
MMPNEMGERPIRVLIADDHALVRQGLRALLSAKPDFEVVGEACDGREAIQMTGQFGPDLVLMDLSMPGLSGIEAIREARKRYPATKFIALTVHKSAEYARATLEAGASGYVLKDAFEAELTAAMRSVMAGHTYLTPAITQQVLSAYSTSGPLGTGSSLLNTLTSRERQVLKLIAEGRTNREIGEHLYLSVKTVEKHRASLTRKLGLRGASALTLFALDEGLISR